MSASISCMIRAGGRAVLLLGLLVAAPMCAQTPSQQPCLTRTELAQLREQLKHIQVKSHITVMEQRYWQVAETADGYLRTGVPLVALENGHLIASARSDDIGMTYIAPVLIAKTGWSTGTALDFLYVLMAALGAISGSICLQLSIRNPWLRVWGYFLLGVVSALSVRWGDVYITQSSILFGVVPWVVFAYREGRRPAAWIAGAFIMGFAASSVSLIRGQSGTAALIIAILLFLWTPNFARMQRVLIVVALALGILVPMLYARSVIHRRDEYLKQVEPNAANYDPQHLFWHTIYIGMAFVPNPYVPLYRDEIAADRVCQSRSDVHYASTEYEKVLRSATVEFVESHPGLALENIGVKALYVLGDLLIAANFGLIAAWRRRKPPVIEVAFVLAMLFNSVFGLLAIPTRPYLLGFTAAAALFGFYSLVYAFEERRETA